MNSNTVIVLDLFSLKFKLSFRVKFDSYLNNINDSFNFMIKNNKFFLVD